MALAYALTLGLLIPIHSRQPDANAMAPAPSRRESIATLAKLAATSATVAAAALAAAPNAAKAASADKKSYVTMDEYNKRKKQDLKDEKLYGLFEQLRTRAAQTAEFDRLADKEEYVEISRLSRAWDTSIRKELLDAAAAELEGKAKDEGAALSKLVLDDLKVLDKLAKAGSKADVPSTTASLKSHVLDFVALEPSRLQEKFGISDL